MTSEAVDHVHQKIVREGAGRNHVLLGEGDRTGLRRADPDGQVPLAVLFLEEHERLIGRQLDVQRNAR